MEDIEDDVVTETTFNLLRDFLQPNSTLTLDITAPKLLELLPSQKAVGSTDLMAFNNICITFAEQIPYHHPSQHKLAALMEYLAGSMKLNVSNPTPCGGERIEWIGGELQGVLAGMCQALSTNSGIALTCLLRESTRTRSPHGLCQCMGLHS